MSLSSPTEFDSLFEPLLDSDGAAQLLKIHPKTLQRMARRGEITGVQIGKLWRFRRSELNARMECISKRSQPCRLELERKPEWGEQVISADAYCRVTRKNGTVAWEYLWRELDTDGTVRPRSVVIDDISNIQRNPRRSGQLTLVLPEDVMRRVVLVVTSHLGGIEPDRPSRLNLTTAAALSRDWQAQPQLFLSVLLKLFDSVPSRT
jgi:excisionase family DNA binding protein